MELSRRPLLALARSPGGGAPVVLSHGRFPAALLLVVVATVVSSLAALRVADETLVDDLFFGSTRHPAVQAMIETLGPERTAVVVYLVQSSFDAVLIATAITPLFVWVLASSAVHASARMAGIRLAYLPMLTFFGYAAALTLTPANLATLALGTRAPVASQVAQLVGAVCLAWLAIIAYRGVRAYYGVDRDRAMRILIIAIVLFYLVPMVLILVTAAAIVVAAVVLGYF